MKIGRQRGFCLPPWRDLDELHTEGFTRRELIIVVRNLSELANGVLIPEWEFSTLTGVEREEVRTLLHLIHRMVVGPTEY